MNVNASHKIKLYAKPEYKSGWRNYQVDLTKPDYEAYILNYGVNMKYRDLERIMGGRRTFKVGEEYFFTIVPNNKDAIWIKENLYKDFIIFCENKFIANGIRMQAELEYDYPITSTKIKFQGKAEIRRVFYIPEFKGVLLPHESIKHLYQ